MTPPRQSNRGFGLTFAVVFAVVFVVGNLGFGAWLVWAIVLAAVFLITALAWPGVLMPLNRLWGVLVGRLAVMNNFVLLGTFYYVVILPTGVVLRLFGWDPMNRTAFSHSESSWSPVTRKVTVETYRDPF